MQLRLGCAITHHYHQLVSSTGILFLLEIHSLSSSPRLGSATATSRLISSHVDMLHIAPQTTLQKSCIHQVPLNMNWYVPPSFNESNKKQTTKTPCVTGFPTTHLPRYHFRSRPQKVISYYVLQLAHFIPRRIPLLLEG